VDLRDAFFDKLYELAVADPDIILLTADMDALSLKKFKHDLPNQYINVGIAEQQLINLAAGLALECKKVFVYAIAPFITQRCYEQIKVSLSYMNLPVTIIGMGPGVTYGSDGPTHHCTQDIANMRALPNMVIYSVSDECVVNNIIEKCNFQNILDSPTYIRLDKGCYPKLYSDEFVSDFGKGFMTHGVGDTVIISTGTLVHTALEVQKEVEDVCVIDLFMLKPYSFLLLDNLKNVKQIITLEEHSLIGGLGSLISELLTDNNLHIPLKRLGLKDSYREMFGSRSWIHTQHDLDKPGIISALKGAYCNES